MRYAHLFWDFDGTLYDSYPQIVRAMRLALLEFQIPCPDEKLLLKECKKTVSHAIRTFAAPFDVDLEKLRQRYDRLHQQSLSFPLYEGVKECLAELREAGVRHYLYTHRDQSAVLQLRRDGLEPIFSDRVVAEDGFPMKPAPDALLFLMRRNGLKPEECAMIGDRAIDIQSGHSAGMAGLLFDPDGFYTDCTAEGSFRSMKEITNWILERP